jgi:hypothetical protein
VVRPNDSGNHCVAEIAWPTLHFSGCHQDAGLLCGFRVKRDDLLVHACQKLLESLAKNGTSLATSYDLQSEANLENRNGRGPDRCSRLSIKPSDNFRFGNS